MNKPDIHQTIERVKNMEAVFDFLQNMVQQKSSAVCREDWFRLQLANLLDYYDNGLWLSDYHLDEQGLLPQNLKRGVLSEDGVYNFITELKDFETL